MLKVGGLHPSHYVGAEIPILGTNANWDTEGEYFVAEGDESDGTLAFYHPEHAIVLNIEEEHLDYYADLASEIDLVARIDGSTQVGHGDAFGLLVELRHTTDIERESGGFGRYLRNQNDISYSYNYGRPTENYRNKFAEAATETLKEHFEVLSITFQEEGVHSRATEQYGWRVTPYAYVMLKPRGPQIDRVPQLRLDLDFLDTSGYVVLPIETDVIAIDAKAEHGPARPAEKIEVTQILDERQAKDGKLVLEVKAQSRGLPPRLE